MAKAELGTKRTCPETDKKFYDLNKDPVISPYTGKSYPLSFFDLPSGPSRAKPAPPIKAVQPEPLAQEEEEEDDEVELEGAEVVSLEDADDDTAADDSKNMPDLGDNTDDDIDDVEVDDDDDDDDNAFLAVDDDDDDDVSDIIPVSGDDDDDS